MPEQVTSQCLHSAHVPHSLARLPAEGVPDGIQLLPHNAVKGAVKALLWVEIRAVQLDRGGSFIKCTRQVLVLSFDRWAMKLCCIYMNERWVVVQLQHGAYNGHQ